MKFRIIYTCFALATGLFLWLGNTGGVGAVQGRDLTNSPTANGFCGNSFCHDDGQFSPNLVLQLLDNGSPVSEYTPGQTYTLSVTIEASGTPVEYGFQAVALDGNNTSAGLFGTPANGQQITALGNGNDYWEHRGAQSSNQFEIEWTAPTNGDIDTVTFYSSGIAANDGNGSGGDGAASSSLSVTATMINNLTKVPALAAAINVSPNPVQEIAQVYINTDVQNTLHLYLFDINGKQIYQQSIDGMTNGQEPITIYLADMATGVYYLHLTDGVRTQSTSIVKQ
ncbi:MAG: choice-of-anchor V domain-containing protein [Bacteroidota bacterium]